MIRRQEGPILVLGGSGFLGAHLVRAASAGGGRVVSACRHPERAPRSDPGAGAPLSARVDAADEGALAELLEAHRPGCILLAAALANPEECEQRPELARRLNSELPERVAAWCAERGARLVHVSTDLVFGAESPPPAGFREEDPPAPVSVYGATKAAGERALLERDPAALVVRLPLLYGDSGGRGRGASDSLLAAVERGERAPLFLDEWRTPLAVEDAAAAIVELAGEGQRGLLHVAGPERVSRLQLGLAVLIARGLPPDEAQARVRPARRAEHGGRAARPEDVSLDSARARALLATPLRRLREALTARRGSA